VGTRSPSSRPRREDGIKASASSGRLRRASRRLLPSTRSRATPPRSMIRQPHHHLPVVKVTRTGFARPTCAGADLRGALPGACLHRTGCRLCCPRRRRTMTVTVHAGALTVRRNVAPVLGIPITGALRSDPLERFRRQGGFAIDTCVRAAVLAGNRQTRADRVHPREIMLSTCKRHP